MWPFRGDGTGRSDARLGRRGERLAARTLRREGLKILARNYRCPAGEVDLIALDPSTRAACGAETIAFVEVKTRASARHVAPESAVDRRKQRQLAGVASYYLAHHPAADYAVRYDVVSVIIADGADPDVRHIVDAFVP